MDYFFLSSLRQNAPSNLIVSYNIACQWARNLRKRTGVYPAEHSLAFRDCSKITYFIPKFHLPRHRPLCQADFSFNFTPFVGRMDGEAVERGWGAINAISSSTKEMGPGSRRDTLDDHFGDYNWRKISSMCEFGSLVCCATLTNALALAITFLRKVKEAVPARAEHTLAFEEFNAALAKPSTQAWSQLVKAWEEDKTKPNPFRATLRSKCSLYVRATMHLKLMLLQLCPGTKYSFSLQRRRRQKRTTRPFNSFTMTYRQVC